MLSCCEILLSMPTYHPLTYPRDSFNTLRLRGWYTPGLARTHKSGNPGGAIRTQPLKGLVDIPISNAGRMDYTPDGPTAASYRTLARTLAFTAAGSTGSFSFDGFVLVRWGRLTLPGPPTMTFYTQLRLQGNAQV